jgi:hypothetical protein
MGNQVSQRGQAALVRQPQLQAERQRLLPGSVSPPRPPRCDPESGCVVPNGANVRYDTQTRERHVVDGRDLEHDEVDHDGCFPPHRLHEICPANPNRDLPVYTTIHRIRRDVIAAIDDPYSIEQLRDPRMNISVVRPLVDRFYEDRDVSMSMFLCFSLLNWGLGR